MAVNTQQVLEIKTTTQGYLISGQQQEDAYPLFGNGGQGNLAISTIFHLVCITHGHEIQAGLLKFQTNFVARAFDVVLPRGTWLNPGEPCLQWLHNFQHGSCTGTAGKSLFWIKTAAKDWPEFRLSRCDSPRTALQDSAQSKRQSPGFARAFFAETFWSLVRNRFKHFLLFFRFRALFGPNWRNFFGPYKYSVNDWQKLAADNEVRLCN